jgi:hypothetical protein
MKDGTGEGIGREECLRTEILQKKRLEELERLSAGSLQEGKKKRKSKIFLPDAVARE